MTLEIPQNDRQPAMNIMLLNSVLLLLGLEVSAKQPNYFIQPHNVKEFVNVRTEAGGRTDATKHDGEECRFSIGDIFYAEEMKVVGGEPWCRVKVVKSETCDPNWFYGQDMWVLAKLTKKATPVPNFNPNDGQECKQVIKTEATKATEHLKLLEEIADGFDAATTLENTMFPIVMRPEKGKKANCRISSLLGFRRDPIFSRTAFHAGVDVAAPAGTPIRSPRRGIVVSTDRVNSSTKTGYGNQIQILFLDNKVSANQLKPLKGKQTPAIRKHFRVNPQYIKQVRTVEACGHTKTTYLPAVTNFEVKMAHLLRIPDHLQPGRIVEKGEIIGYVGSTGKSSGNHLHMEVFADECSEYKRPRLCDPSKYFNYPARSIVQDHYCE